MEKGRLRICLCIVVCVQMLMKVECGLVNITYLGNAAVAKGAVCLDGSPGAYHLDEGFGEGRNGWFIKFQGGGWCNTVKDCLGRKHSLLGSSNLMEKQYNFTGIFNFYNWNRVKVRYCDGASFAADVEEVDPVTGLHFRGRRIFLAIVEELLAKGMKNADNVLFAGCSAGAIGTILHCDTFRVLLPTHIRVKCLSDAGFFINAVDITGQPIIQDYYTQVVQTHKLESVLPSYCTSKMKPELCFFPQNVAPGIQTPLFILNSAYDGWQINNILVPTVSDPHGLWNQCKNRIHNCSADQLQTLHDFRQEFLKALGGPPYPPSRAMFINSCLHHCQTEIQEQWISKGSKLLNHTSIAKAVADWFYDRNMFQQIDCPYPCEKLCL